MGVVDPPLRNPDDEEGPIGSRKKEPRSNQSTALPLRWVDIPHYDLYRRAIDALTLGSRERAKEDALRHALRRRLFELNRADHRRYVEIESGRILEALRAIRDEYRRYLEEQGCKPIAEMYWVVFKFGILQYAVKLLRDIASEYVIGSKVPFEEWEILYGNCFIPTISLSGDRTLPEEPETPSPSAVRGNICGLVTEQAFRRVLTGGPFGCEGQLFLTRRYPAFSFWGPDMTFPQIVERRQILWKKCQPWTTGLSQLFDSTQEELNFQYSLLADDARHVESSLIELSAFERIAYENLVDMRRNAARARNLKTTDWEKLFDRLDKTGVAIDDELTDTPKQVLVAVRRKGHQISGWKDCYEMQRRVQLENGRTYALRREVMHAVHNAAKKAAYNLNKVYRKEVTGSRGGKMP